jgi:hypothetical protein
VRAVATSELPDKKREFELLSISNNANIARVGKPGSRANRFRRNIQAGSRLTPRAFYITINTCKRGYQLDIYELRYDLEDDVSTSPLGTVVDDRLQRNLGIGKEGAIS